MKVLEVKKDFIQVVLEVTSVIARISKITYKLASVLNTAFNEIKE